MGKIQRIVREKCRIGVWRTLVAMALMAFVTGFTPRPCFGYSVIMHEAIIDSEWDSTIRPVLLQRFARATPDELRVAKSYAYGGSVIQDLGYYPFGSQFFSHLTHYVRSGDFVESLINESHDINEYAFALGALSHYCADIEGHSLGVNRAVPLLYPKLGRKYGPVMTWEDSPWAHLLTEFGFDTVEVVAGHVAPQAYHDYIGFRVPEPLLKRAFLKTYGLQLPDQFLSMRLSLLSYRKTASRFIPRMTRVAWAMKREKLEASAHDVQHRELFHLDRANIEASWERTRTLPGLGDKLTAAMIHIIPKVGPLNVFQFHTPTYESESLLAVSLKATVADYKVKLASAHVDAPNINLDTGGPIHPGGYRFGDQTFAIWLDRLDHTHFAHVDPALRASLLGFYAEPGKDGMRRNGRKWRKIQRELRDLKAASVER
jgi:hypothetical protein